VWSPWSTLGGAFVGAALLLGGPAATRAAVLPAHEPLRILIISDEVNPHGLSADQLTQPGDLSAALGNAGSGVEVALVEEVDSACIDDALALLGGEGVDVIVYFAHLPATGCDGSARQPELTTAMEQHLQERAGVVVFHHGIYEAGGKEAILQLIGGRASSVAWDTVVGQDVIAVGGDHPVASQSMQYEGMRSFSGLGVPDGDYPYFNNTPDERYDAMALLTAAGEERTLLFASTDGAGANARVLGYDLWRPGWTGHVVFYQPGEFQPSSLDLDGNNFQVLANAILYAATTQEDPGEPMDTDTGTEPGEDTGPGSETGGEGSDEAGQTSAPGSSDDGGSGTGTTANVNGAGDEEGCGCRSSGGGAGALGVSLVVLGLAARRRRRG
jgi:MYXO-CTERM domain-containing protein